MILGYSLYSKFNATSADRLWWYPGLPRCDCDGRYCKDDLWRCPFSSIDTKFTVGRYGSIGANILHRPRSYMQYSLVNLYWRRKISCTLVFVLSSKSC